MTRKKAVKYRLSFVVPVYNDADRLVKCLESITDLGLHGYEIIVVDNNCRDDSAKKAAEYPCVKVVIEHRQGIVFARDVGFDAAIGDIIVRLDADTILPAGWAAELARIVDKYGADNDWAVTGPGSFYNAVGTKAHGVVHGFVYYYVNRLLLGHYLLWGSNMALTKSAWQKVRDEVCETNSIHEDMDLSVHLFRHDIPIYFENKLKATMELKRMQSPRVLWIYLMRWAVSLEHHNRMAGLLCYPIAVTVFVLGISIGTVLVGASKVLDKV